MVYYVRSASTDSSLTWSGGWINSTNHQRSNKLRMSLRSTQCARTRDVYEFRAGNPSKLRDLVYSHLIHVERGSPCVHGHELVSRTGDRGSNQCTCLQARACGEFAGAATKNPFRIYSHERCISNKIFHQQIVHYRTHGRIKQCRHARPRRVNCVAGMVRPRNISQSVRRGWSWRITSDLTSDNP